MAPPLRPPASQSSIAEQLKPYRKPIRRPVPQDEEAAYDSPIPTCRYRWGLSKYSSSDTEPISVRLSATTPAVSPPANESEIPGKQSMWIEQNMDERNHPDYHCRQRVTNFDILSSSSLNDPILDNIDAPAETSPLRSSNKVLSDAQSQKEIGCMRGVRPRGATSIEKDGRQSLKKLARERLQTVVVEEMERQSQFDILKVPSFWNVYCAIVTFWCPNIVLKWFGVCSKVQQRAWREKMGLISIILQIMASLGFLTFGFTAVVCGTPPLRLRVNNISSRYMIFHGSAYDLSESHHPAAKGIPAGSNILHDLLQQHGGQDGSFLFQNVNGKCKGLITLTPGSDVPTNANGDLAWYFPCTTFNQDGSSPVTKTIPYYLGYSCHTIGSAREAFYTGLKSTADVYFTWDDTKNSSRNLMVYSGTVLDLDLLKWFNETQVTVPSQFIELSDRSSTLNAAVHGRDVTHAFQSAENKKIAQCLQQIIKVGSVDNSTVGCIASKVVLYVSLILILSIVVSRFVLATIFQWYLSRKFAAAETSQSPDARERHRQIEEWSDDIYRAPTWVHRDPGSAISSSNGLRKRQGIFLPTISRFTSPYAVDRTARVGCPQFTTMTTQSSTTALFSPTTMFSNASSEYEVPSTVSFIHDAVVPQPPVDWQPFGYPLVHALCLVTAYSEGEMGIRSTLDSVAMTDYPNSHKTILIVCDGMIKGKGESRSTPEIVLGMMKDFTVLPNEVVAFSYVAVASGSKRHGMAKVYSGFYDYGAHSKISTETQQRVPMMCVVKCGTRDEANKSKPGNRGKRDSQIILMSLLQKVMFDERMTELEFEMFNALWRITGISPDFYEVVLMVDADTKVFPDSLTHMISAMVKDPEIMGLCGETKIANKRNSWVSAIQVFEYFISHHLSKSFESVFGGVTCLPGCFCMYRIKAPKGGQNNWVPILANPDVVEHYSENVVDTLHTKNLLLLGEDRYLSTLMLRIFPKRKQVFVPQAVCKTTAPETFAVLLSQRRRWINSTVHNLMELILVRDLCGTFCFSMQFVVFIDLVSTLALPAALAFTFYLIIISIVRKPVQVIPLVLLGLILGLPGVLVIITGHRWSYLLWMFIYLISLPVWNLVLPMYAFWKFDDFSWGDTRKTAGENTKEAGIEYEGEFDSSKITMKRWGEFERERRLRSHAGWSSRYGTQEGSTIQLPQDRHCRAYDGRPDTSHKVYSSI